MEEINYTSADYASAFSQAKLTEHQKQILRTHYHTPDKTITARDMAKAMNYRNWSAANLHYGHLAAEIGKILGWSPENPAFDSLYCLVCFEKPPGHEWNWTLRPEVAEALEILGWVGHPPVVAESGIETATRKSLFRLAIYVNASSERLLSADRGSLVSLPLTEEQAWKTGRRIFEEAQALGQELPLVFAQWPELSFWAVARDIRIQGKTTEYRFAHLWPLRGYRRSHLVVDSKDGNLPDTFIRSYAIIRTPEFLSESLVGDETSFIPEELVGLEGERHSQMVAHRHREQKLRDAKIQETLRRNDGHLVCEVPGCDFDFWRVYGALGREYAHVHHLRPLSEYSGGEATGLGDLAIVCANCHAMIHRYGDCRSLNELLGTTE